MSIFKACDIRAPYPDELRDEHAFLLGQAVAIQYRPAQVVIGGDGRLSTPQLKRMLTASLVAAGCHVVDLGIIPTPLFYFARYHLGIKTGVMVTASHNPPHYNGFKLAFGDMPVTEEEMAQLQELMAQKALAPEGKGIKELVDPIPAYTEFGKSQIKVCDGLKVVVDYGNGVGAITGPKLWEHSGANVISLFCNVDGRFPDRSPNPAVAGNLTAVSRTVVDEKADFGVAYDGDADRVAIVDELGHVVKADKVIALMAQDRLRNGVGAVVYDQKCSRLVSQVVRQAGGVPVMEKSGHTFIKTTFLKKAAVYAGELSGHHFFRSLPQGDDGVLASLFFAQMLKRLGQPLSDLVETLPDYPITPDIRLPVSPDEAERILSKLRNGLADEATLSYLDGVRVGYSDGWGLARQSVTEPLLTLRFEGENQDALRQIMSRFVAAAPALAGRLPEV